MLLDSHNIAEIVAFIAWSIWFNRNALRVGSHTLPITQIHRDALERLQEFQAAIDPPLHIPTVLHPAHWLPPLPQQFKANCDGLCSTTLTVPAWEWLSETMKAWLW